MSAQRGRKADIVVTTIFEPAWLEGYLANLRRHGRDADTTIRIICDRKTPASVFAAAAAAQRQGFRIDCPTLEEQEQYLKHLGVPDGFVPWNTDNRRNIGFLRAWADGTDLLISIDDDNYCVTEDDFVGAHSVVGSREPALLATGPWFNACSLLQSTVQGPIYPRGLPYAARRPELLRQPTGAPTPAQPIAVNLGLWLGEPDVDAVTRLAQRPRIHAVSGEAVLLSPETWSPINTQNTGLMRAAMPAYYYVRMGFALQGMKIDRYGDILSGYFVQKCAKHLGHCVRIGSPVLDHRRTAHDLLKDLYQELAGIMLVEDLLPWLTEARLQGSDYATAYASLAAALSEQAPRFKGTVWDEGGRAFLVETATCMQTWLRALQQIA